MISDVLSTVATDPESVSLARDIAIPLFLGLVGGSVGGSLIVQAFASADRRRDNYAEAVAALIAWSEYPYMVRRRVDDLPATLERLTACGHELQERLVRLEAWVTAESRSMGNEFSALVSTVKAATGPLLNEAWTSAPVTSPSGMNLEAWGRDESASIRNQVSAFRRQTFRRFGWRRRFGIGR